jgi:hypothetical protein
MRRGDPRLGGPRCNDDGRDRDIEYARMVAGAFGSRHHLFLPGPNA